ncbi:MAG: hypothetical protein IJ622_07770 [Bacteroidales bacterium]|nr:hypothetical protein [Bacteroidales bacterium]
MKSRNLFLGIIFVAIGIVALLGSLDVIHFSWHIAWKLWPMLLIFVGIAVLPIKDWLKALLLLATLAVGVLLYQNEANKRSHHWLFSQSVEKERVELPVV